MDPYGTHQRLLVKASLMTRGLMVEFGAGWYSTPILHEISQAQGRKLVTIDNNAGWLARFQQLASPLHELICVDTWDGWQATEQIGLAFIDHAPGPRRPIEIARLLSCVDLFVLHDTEADGYDWDTIRPLLEVVDEDRSLIPWTTIVRAKPYG